mmetsp:Transcript_8/g.6  ORF Transcript_8/g.6 Transcript_8/m.6 type:complete len:311 (+) Transcript_8:234-1166(+)
MTKEWLRSHFQILVLLLAINITCSFRSQSVIFPFKLETHNQNFSFDRLFTEACRLCFVFPAKAFTIPAKTYSSEGSKLEAKSDGMYDFVSLKYRKLSNKHHIRKKYENAGGIIYRQSVLSKVEFNGIRDDLALLPIQLTPENTSSIAKNRIGCEIPSNSKTAKIIGSENGSIFSLINQLHKSKRNKMVLSEDVPIELRIYEKKGACMDWHYDDVLYEPEQVEIVLTLENKSDCVTRWEENPQLASTSKNTPIIKEIETQPNSAIILRAGGVRHKVTALKYGRRAILKFIYVEENAEKIGSRIKRSKQFKK